MLASPIKIESIMGLFSFLKNAGTALFGGSKKATPAAPAAPAVESAAEQLEEMQIAMRLTNHVTQLGLKVEGLNITVEDDKATITGTAASQSEKEKVILAVGNVAGIATVDDQMFVAAAPEAAPEPEAVFYTVVKGDTLSKIAKQHYGNPNKYPVIFEANRPMLTHPDKIYPGQALRIPPLA
jgi:nucleoid-associated protein YgaU